MDKVVGCLSAPINELLQAVAANSDSAGKPIRALLERVKNLSGEDLHSQLSEWLVQQFDQPTGQWQTWFDMLFWTTVKCRSRHR